MTTGKYEPAELSVEVRRLEAHTETEILVLRAKRHLDRESDPRIGVGRRLDQQRHLGIAAEAQLSTAQERSVIAQSNGRVPAKHRSPRLGRSHDVQVSD
jgi:GTPase Era involved in 16S rRNA processing